MVARRPDPIDELERALAGRVAAGAPGALARLEAPGQESPLAAAVGRAGRGSAPALRPDTPFRAASVTKTFTAVTVQALAAQGLVSLDRALGELLPGGLLARLRGLGELALITPRMLLGHTAGLYDYFHDPAFARRVARDPGRAWEPIELLEHAARHGRPEFAPGAGFRYSDSGYVLAGLLAEHVAGAPLHELYRTLILDRLELRSTWLEGREQARGRPARHYRGEEDMSRVTPTIDWAGGGLVTTAPDLARFARGLWDGSLIAETRRAELTRWTPDARFAPGFAVRYDAYGLGIGRLAVAGVELIGHTGFWGAFAWYAPRYDAVLVGTHNDAAVDRAPLVTALCRLLAKIAASGRPL